MRYLSGIQYRTGDVLRPPFVGEPVVSQPWGSDARMSNPSDICARAWCAGVCLSIKVVSDDGTYSSWHETRDRRVSGGIEYKSLHHCTGAMRNRIQCASSNNTPTTIETLSHPPFNSRNTLLSMIHRSIDHPIQSSCQVLHCLPSSWHYMRTFVIIHLNLPRIAQP